MKKKSFTLNFDNRLFFDTLSSTNDFALRLIQNSSYNDGAIIVASYQTKGKGQRKNNWESSKNKNLLLSIILKSDLNVKDQFKLNICTSLAVRDFLAKYVNHHINIKWPNDIIINNKKISGILIDNRINQSKIKHSIIGIGINVNQTQFSKNVLKATSLQKLNKKQYHLDDIEKDLLECIKFRYGNLDNFKNYIKEYNSFLFLKNKEVHFLFSGKRLKGFIKSVNNSGHLVIQSGKSEHKIFSSNQLKLTL